jgi:hypothetical protein
MSTDLIQAPPREIAAAFKASGLFPDLKSEAQAYVKVIAGAEMGIGPMASMSGINVIQGKPTLSANLLAALVKRHPAYDYRVTDHSDTTCRIEFRQDGEPSGVSEFTIEDAKRAGVANGQNWKKYPQAMLFARALTQGVRWYAPDVSAGPAYVPEELGVNVNHEGEPVTETVEAEVVEPSRLDLLAELLDEHEFTEEQRSALRSWVRTEDGGVSDERVEDALEMLSEGNSKSLLTAMAFDATVAA